MNQPLPSAPTNSISLIEIPYHEQQSLDELRQWLVDATGMNYHLRKRDILYSRLQSMCWRLGIDNIEELNRLLHDSDNSEWLAKEVVRIASTNYTFFFRETETLDFLRQHILPSLPLDEKWRIWSAAAASGEEAYSVAMLLAEVFGPQMACERAAILGTDISYPMIEQAESAAYSEQRLDCLPSALRSRYFLPTKGGKSVLIPALKDMCTFRRLNLMSAPWPFHNPFHVILCRNVFYYFDKSQQFELVERLYDAATPKAWLLTSVTETFHAMPIRWKRVTAGVWKKG